jgi:hypothetical protein
VTRASATLGAIVAGAAIAACATQPSPPLAMTKAAPPRTDVDAKLLAEKLAEQGVPRRGAVHSGDRG